MSRWLGRNERISSTATIKGITKVRSNCSKCAVEKQMIRQHLRQIQWNYQPDDQQTLQRVLQPPQGDRLPSTGLRRESIDLNRIAGLNPSGNQDRQAPQRAPQRHQNMDGNIRRTETIILEKAIDQDVISHPFLNTALNTQRIEQFSDAWQNLEP